MFHTDFGLGTAAAACYVLVCRQMVRSVCAMAGKVLSAGAAHGNSGYIALSALIADMGKSMEY